MTNYSNGHYAEKVAARYLESIGYSILAMNWRHARAEVDIIAQKRPRLRAKGPVVFFEVKYRKTDAQGRGLEYIAPQKLQQMQFAAALWVAENSYGGDYMLGAIELMGERYEITNVIDCVF